MAEDPVSVWQGKIVVSGVTLHLHVLDNGQRIIDGQDVWDLLAAWADSRMPTEAEAADLRLWMDDSTPGLL